MPDLIQVANDLKDMPDQYLAQQMQKPDGSVPPWLVASEVARRDRLRSGQAKAQAPASSVSQDLLKSLYAKIPPTAGLAAPPPGGPGGPAPPGMPPVNLTPGQATMGTPPPGATPPSSFKMPSQGMAEGGEVDDGSSDDEESAPPPDIYNLPMLSRRAQMDQLMAPPIPTSATTPQTAPPVMPQAPAAMPGPAGEASRMAPDTGTDIPTLVDGAAKKYQLPPELIMAVIKRESSGRPGAIGPEVKGGQHAIGLMQVLPSTAASEFGIKDPQLLLDPAINVDTGARYLKKLMVMFNNDPQTALAAYYTGPGNVRKYGGAPEYTSGYTSSVLGTANALRAHYGLPQMNQLPGGMTSRLLQPTPPAPAADQPAQQLAAAGPPADSQPPATDDTGTDASGPSDTAAAATPAKEGPLNQVYTPTEPAEITSLKGQIAAKQEGHQSVRDQIRDTYKQDNLDLLSDAAKTLIGPQQDYSKYSGAIQEVMDMAKKNMHPKISDMLIQFGTALMASKEHNFGVAVGHAGQSMLANINAMQEQGTKDYLTAAKAGVDLQDKMDLYQAKVGQYKMARLAAQQTGIVADERTYQTQLTGLQKELDTAQNKFNTSITSPYAQQTMAMALMNREHIVFDPSKYKDPITQLSAMGRTDLVQESAMVGKAGFTPKVANPNQQTWEGAIRTVAQANNIPLPDGPLNVNSLPVELQGAVRDEYAKQLAKTQIATQQGSAEMALKDLDPNFIGAYVAQHGSLPTGFSRNPYIVAKAWHMATDYMKAKGLTPMIMFAEQNAASANKAALTGLTKTTENVEAFSKLAELNMNTLQGLAAKVQDLGAPVLNHPVRDLARQWQGDTRVSDMQASLATVRAEVARVLNSASANGELSIPAKAEMEKLLGDDFTYNMLIHALGVFRTEMANRRQIYGNQVRDLTQRTVVGQTGAGAPTGGGQYRNLHKNGNITIGVGADGKWHNVATGELYQ